MSILTRCLPDFIEIEGVRYGIRTDFRVWIEFETVALDFTLEDVKKAAGMIGLCYLKNQLPPKFSAAIEEAMRFYAGPKTQERTNVQPQEKARSAVYSFVHDAEYIYSAFYTQYGIDLQEAKLHWWQFLALFKGLGEENQIVKMMGYRGMDLSKIKDKEQRKHYRELQSLYRLPDMRSEEQKERDMMESLGKLF